MEEKWKFIPDYEGYMVSSLGRIKLVTKKKEKVRILNSSAPYLRINLSKKGVVKTYLVHRLVAESFVPNPENKSYVNHIDGDKNNNKVENLEWCTQQENIQHSWNTGLTNNKGENHHSTILTEEAVNQIRSSSISQRKLAKMFNVSQSTISNIITNKVWKP